MRKWRIEKWKVKTQMGTERTQRLWSSLLSQVADFADGVPKMQFENKRVDVTFVKVQFPEL